MDRCEVERWCTFRCIAFLPIPAQGIWQGILVVLWGVTVLALAIGAESLTHPERAIQRYQEIMRRINWEVRPINKTLEKRSTRRLGLLLITLSLLMAFLLLRVPFFP